MGLSPQQIASQMEIGERYKQLRINARLTGMQVATDMMKTLAASNGGVNGYKPSVGEMIDNAEQVENYIMGGIEPPEPVTQATIIPAKNFPR